MHSSRLVSYRRWQQRTRSRALTRLAQRHRDEFQSFLREEHEAEPWEPPSQEEVR